MSMSKSRLWVIQLATRLYRLRQVRDLLDAASVDAEIERVSLALLYMRRRVARQKEAALDHN